MRNALRSTLPLLAGLLGGCGGIVGNVTAGMNSTYIMPGILSGGDVGVSCAAGEGLGAMVGGFAPWSKAASKATVLVHASAALCLEDDVREAQLARARAFHSSAFDEARDAEVIEDRAHVIAARRYLASWNALVENYGVPEPGEACPNLHKEMDQISYLMGLSSGVLAVLHDLGADGAVGVPQSIPAAVNRAAVCLDNEQWWGVPAAMQASLWALQPGGETGDVWKTLDNSVRLGEAAGVRLSTAYAVQTAATIGDTDRVKAIIAHDAQSRLTTAANSQYAMLDQYGRDIVVHESDRLWTEKTGSRTPIASYGAMPVPPQPVVLEDDLLQDLPK